MCKFVCQLLLLLVAATTTSKSQNFPLHQFGFNNFFTTPRPDITSSDSFSLFDLDLLKEISDVDHTGNLLISPLSIKLTLAMLLEGATDETERELRMALRLNNKDEQYIREDIKKLLNHFNSGKHGVTLTMANIIFSATNVKLQQQYKDNLSKYYYSSIEPINGKRPKESAYKINDWVNQHTNGLIPRLVDESSINNKTLLLIANALYFKGVWEKAFSEQGTESKTFYLLDGSSQMTPMMGTVDNFRYIEDNDIDAKIIELPYSGGEFSMLIALPNGQNNVNVLARDIKTQKSIKKIVEKMTETEVYVSIPRFAIEYSSDLVHILPKVLITNTLTPAAKFYKMLITIESCYLTNLLHKARIEVNEQGTVAAAATGAVVIPLMGNMKPRFRADHPFLFFIRHIPTNTILFEGRVSKPEESPPQQQQHGGFQRPQNQHNNPQRPSNQQTNPQRPLTQQVNPQRPTNQQINPQRPPNQQRVPNQQLQPNVHQANNQHRQPVNQQPGFLGAQNPQPQLNPQIASGQNWHSTTKQPNFFQNSPQQPNLQFNQANRGPALNENFDNNRDYFPSEFGVNDDRSPGLSSGFRNENNKQKDNNPDGIIFN